MTTIRESLGEYPFLDELPDSWLDRLAELGDRVTYPAGLRLFSEGGHAEHFWLVNSGSVGLDLHVPGRGHVLIDTVHPGSVLGWSWLFPPYRWHFGAVAARQVHAIQFSGVRVMALCRDNPVDGMDLMRRFVGVVVDRLQATRLRLLDLYGYRT
jgi:CRP/FNR family transcriptional regulator, cyclic AMP receptor protein